MVSCTYLIPLLLLSSLERWCVHAKLLQSCLTLCHPMDHSPSGSSVLGILQARNWSVLLSPPPGDLPDPGIEPMSLMSNLHWQTGSLPLLPPGNPKICDKVEIIMNTNVVVTIYSAHPHFILMTPYVIVKWGN